MPDEPVISFECPSCGKSYRVAKAMAGRSAKCKKCGERMRVPKPAPKVSDDDDFIPLVEEEEEKPRTAPKDSEPVTITGDIDASAADKLSAGDDFFTPPENFSMADLAALADPEEDEAELEPSVFKSQVAFAAPQAAPRNKAAAIGGGLMKNLTAMWEALVNPSQADGHIPLARRISMGGAFMLINAVLLTFFALVRASPAKLQQVRGVLNNKAEFGWMLGPDTTAPMMLTAVAGFIVGLCVIGWRYWSPRQEDEAKLVSIVFWIMLVLVIGSSLIALVGGVQVTLILAQAGSFGVLLAAAAFGAWVYLRLASDGDGSMSLLLVAPAVIMPVTILILIVANVPSEAIDQLPWGEILLYLFLMFLAMMLMGGAISFMILIVLPFHLIGLVQRPPLPIDVPGGAGKGMMVVGGFCVLCYLLLVIARWRIMLKPVAWQFVILLFGASLMAGVNDFAYTAQVGRVGRQIAEENERLTRILLEAGRIGPGVTASHEPFTNSDRLSGPDRDEIIYLSNGERITQKDGIIQGWEHSEDDRATARTWGTPADDYHRSSTDRNLFDQQSDSDARDKSGEDRSAEQIAGKPRRHSGHIHRVEFGEGFKIVNGPNPDGKMQAGTRASWKPYPHSPIVTIEAGADIHVLYFANGDIKMNPSDDTLMDYGVIHDTRPTPILAAAPVFTPDELAKGFVDNQKRYSRGHPDLAWPMFSQPAIDMSEAKPHDVFGYEIDLLPGYEIVHTFKNPESGLWTATIDHDSAEQPGQFPKLIVHLVPQKFKDGVGEDANWRQSIRQLSSIINIDRSHDLEYGWIQRQAFARYSPKQHVPHNYRSRIFYITTSIYTSRHLAFSISSSMQTRKSILACEAMARSVRHRLVDQIDVSDKKVYHNDMAQYKREEMIGTGAVYSGIFAMPKPGETRYDGDTSYQLNAHDRRGVWMGWEKRGGLFTPSIYIYMQPLPKGVSRDQRVFAEGAQIKQADKQEGYDPRLDPYFVESYGLPITYERLWNGEIFARVEHGPSNRQHASTRYVEYSGFLGDYWTVIRVFYGGNHENASLEAMEQQLRSLRLLPPEMVKKFAERNLKRILSRESGKIPLAGGLMLAEAYVIDDSGEVVLNPRLSQQAVEGKDGPKSTIPEVDAEALEGFDQWRVHDEVEQYLGSTQSFGSFRFKPLKDLRASAKNSDNYAEWFARTDSGKVGLTLKYEKLLPDQELIKVPMTTDPDSGKVTLQLGRRTLTPSEAPKVTYRDGNGLRVWRILMPQAGGSAVRRCYYVVAAKKGHLVIAADFERDKAVQLQAMDASVASLIDQSQDPID